MIVICRYVLSSLLSEIFSFWVTTLAVGSVSGSLLCEHSIYVHLIGINERRRYLIGYFETYFSMNIKK
jgi:hypothetical protein